MSSPGGLEDVAFFCSKPIRAETHRGLRNGGRCWRKRDGMHNGLVRRCAVDASLHIGSMKRGSE